MTRLTPSPWALSELQIQCEILDIEEDPDIRAVLTRFDGNALVLEEGADLEQVIRGLTTLCNGCDEWAERSDDPERRQFERWARDGLTGLSGRVMKLIMKQRDAGAKPAIGRNHAVME